MTSTVPVCVLNDTRIDRHHGCQRVMDAIEHLLQANGCKVIARNPAHQDWEKNAEFLQALAKTRLIVVNGEGTLHHDRPAGHTLLKIGQWARKHGIPVALVNAGWEANSAQMAGLLADFSLVAVRDAASAAEVQSHGQPCRVVPDLSVYDSVQLAAATQTGNGPVLFADSVNRFTALALERSRQATRSETLAIVYADSGLSGYLRFLRQGIARADLSHPQQLTALLAMRHRIARHGSADTQRFLQRLAQSSLLVSGRFHACTLALATGTPFIAVPSNTRKIAALVADVGLAPWRADSPLDAATILKAQQHGWSDAEKQAISAYLERARSQADQLFRDIRNLVP